MSNRENYIDGVRIYSDNFEDENNKASKKVTTYKKVEATTTTTRIKKEGDKPAQTTTTTTKRSRIQKDLGIPRNSINTINGGIQEFIDSVEGKKEKIVYKGKLKEKSNYLYYVSGIGYVDKDGVPAKKDNKPKEIIVTKKKPKPVREVGKRVTITIQNVRPERKGGELIENFNYYESKNIDERNRESIVIHRRLGDPFYQAIGQGRRSSYNPGHRGRYVLDKEEIGTKVDTSKTRTIETKTTQRNRFENKTYNTTQATRQTNQSGTGRNVRKTVETKTVKVEERKRNIDSNNYRRQKPTESGSAPQKVYDTEKYKRNDNQDKYQKKTEEAQKTLKECNHKGRFNKEVAELEKQYDSIKSREEFMKTTPDSMQDLYDKILEQAESNLESAAAYMESYDYVTNPDPVYLKKLILEGDTLVQKFNNLLEKLVDVDTNPTDLDVKYIDDLTNCLAEMRENQKQTMTS